MEKKIPYDHKIIGKKLKLFFFYKNLNTGLPIWLPYGTYIYNKIKNFIKKINIINKYNEVVTPNIGNYSLYKLSGHLDKYIKNIFKIEYKKKIFLNPMNCPYHCLIYKFYNNISYKEFPIKYYEFGTVFRNEKSGELNGLFRTKVFTQDDGHIYCKNIKEVVKEIDNIINIILIIYKKFQLKNYYIRLSLRDKNYINNEYIGEKKTWIKSEKILIKIIKKKKINYIISYGEAAFYGPKIDFIIKDSLNRNWQLSTIQIDYNTPKRFNLMYINKHNRCICPIMIHRAFLGSIERFIGILIEHKKGYLPLWLLKIQIVIIPIYINHYKYCKFIFNYLIKKKVRCIIDNSYKNLNIKIKKFEKIHIPIMLIVGEKEKVENKIFLRIKNKKNKSLRIKDAFNYILEYISNN
ncbi:MAG: threonine--tRNA ligase [Candidatus Shikimatogenerans bostrichidophilus]|nr:MAG: threonine--tRNA ligase [Candidatus Shikimatogenerans bostrichidophilus]